MKNLYKIVILCFLFIQILPAKKVNAQIDSSFFVYPSSLTCSLPASLSFNIFYSNANSDTVYFNLDFGDGQNNQYSTFNHSFYQSISHTYVSQGPYNVYLTITDDLGNVHVDSLCVVAANSCGSVSGEFYNDINDNCILDAGETPFPYQQVLLTLNGNTLAQTYADNNGIYDFPDVPVGYNYIVRPVLIITRQ